MIIFISTTEVVKYFAFSRFVCTHVPLAWAVSTMGMGKFYLIWVIFYMKKMVVHCNCFNHVWQPEK